MEEGAAMIDVARTIWAISLCLGLLLFVLHFPLGMNPRYDWMHTLSMWLLGISVGAALVPAIS